MPVEIAEPLVSSSAAAASTNAFARLAKAAAPDERRATPVAGITVEQLIVDLLTPMLRDWLDQNLPGHRRTGGGAGGEEARAPRRADVGRPRVWRLR